MSKNKYVSSLDLKLLGARFITIPDSHLEVSHSFSTIRKSKNYELPMLSTMPDDDRLTFQEALAEAQQKAIRKITKKYQQADLPSFQRYKTGEKYSQKQMQEIQKYRNLIFKLKQGNEIIHKEIKDLYREQKLISNQPKTKPVKRIVQANKQAFRRDNRFSLSTQAKKYEHIYEDLVTQGNPYKKQSTQIQKKFSNNNLHKSFENFLLVHNKRVPQFIKNIR